MHVNLIPQKRNETSLDVSTFDVGHVNYLKLASAITHVTTQVM